MAVEFTAVTLDVGDPEAVARFWGRLLDRRPRPDGDGILLPGDETQVGLCFGAPESSEAGQDYLHLHVTSDGAGGQDGIVERTLQLGAVHADVGQSPRGGTKLSWGGPPIDSKTGRCSQRFLLSAADPSAEAQRLTGLGATVLRESDDEIELADPDGHEFTILRR